jgi:hypothetical protein
MNHFYDLSKLHLILKIYISKETFLNVINVIMFYIIIVPVNVYCERTKITNSNQSHKSHRKYKSENGRTRISEYISIGIVPTLLM